MGGLRYFEDQNISQNEVASTGKQAHPTFLTLPKSQHRLQGLLVVCLYYSS